jgi:hypothetical protein
VVTSNIMGDGEVRKAGVGENLRHRGGAERAKPRFERNPPLGAALRENPDPAPGAASPLWCY